MVAEAAVEVGSHSVDNPSAEAAGPGSEEPVAEAVVGSPLAEVVGIRYTAAAAAGTAVVAGLGIQSPEAVVRLEEGIQYTAAAVAAGHSRVVEAGHTAAALQTVAVVGRAAGPDERY